MAQMAPELAHLATLVYTWPISSTSTAYLSTDRRTDRVRTIREIVAEFDGLSGVKAGHEVCATAGLHRATLEDLVSGEILDTELVTRLLDAMQARAREVKPE